MRVLVVFWLLTTTTCSVACAGKIASVQLQPEGSSVLHVGQTATLTVPSNGHFSIGSVGTALRLIKQESQGLNTVYLYRAAHVGDHTLVATPGGPGPDGCISCVTVHYFAQVIR